jgi:nucleoside-diphosphate-sugar epimerase
MIQDWPDWKRLQMVHHADVAQALLLGLLSDGIDGQIFNVAEDAPRTLGELRQLNHLPAIATDVDYKPGSPWDVMSDTLKIRVQLGYRPHFPSFYSAWAAGAT